MVSIVHSHLLLHLLLYPVHLPLNLEPFCLLIHFMYPLQVQVLLLPLLIRHPFTQAYILRQTKIHNGRGSHVLCDFVLVVGDVELYLL